MSVVAARIAKFLASELLSKDGRRRIGTIIIVVVAIAFLPILIIGYIFSSTLDSLGLEITDPDELRLIEEIHAVAPQYNPGGDYDAELEYVSGIPYFSQKDPRWCDIGYGTDQPNGTIGRAGCGPTSAAMVLSSLINRTVTPLETAAWCVENNYRIVGSGTMGGFARAIASEFGLLSYSVAPSPSSEQTLRSALIAGRRVIAHMGAGTFTSNGHYIVLCGLDAFGRVFVADPNSVTRSKQTWELSLICNEVKGNFVVIYPSPQPSPSPPPLGGYYAFRKTYAKGVFSNESQTGQNY